jgi:hypothetical protein
MAPGRCACQHGASLTFGPWSRTIDMRTHATRTDAAADHQPEPARTAPGAAATHALAMQQAIDQSPRMVAQRRVLQSLLPRADAPTGPRAVAQAKGGDVVQRVADESGQVLQVDWAGMDADEAKAYLAKADRGRWQLSAQERVALTWLANPGGPAPQELVDLRAAPVAPDAVPGGSLDGAAAPGLAAGKIGWTALPDAPAEGLALMERALAEMRARRSLSKRKFEARHLSALPAPRAPLFGNPEGVHHAPANLGMGPLGAPAFGYAQLLDMLQREQGLLAATQPFAGGRLTLVERDPPVAGVKLIHYTAAAIDAQPQVVGHLTYGAQTTFLARPANPALQRPLLGKRKGAAPSGDYVLDSRGTITRRYAYCEKNVWQFMDFLTRSRMEGRFQSLSRALGVAAPQLFGASASKNDVQPGGARTPRLTVPQLGVLHQFKGSGNEQRGLSLASTAEGTVLSNAGKSFGSGDGFLLKIDLARVPAGVLVLNHYATDGLRADLGGVNAGAHGDGPGHGYNYEGSAAKNREIYLEHLEPDWIVETRWHGAPLAPQDLGEPRRGDPSLLAPGGVPQWMARVRTATHHGHFTSGFGTAMPLLAPAVQGGLPAPVGGPARRDAVVQAAGVVDGVAVAVPPGLSPEQATAYDRGVSLARHYAKGYYHGRLRRALGTAAAFGAVAKGQEDLAANYQDIGAMQHAPEAYWTGFGHALSGRALVLLMDANFLIAGGAQPVDDLPQDDVGPAAAWHGRALDLTRQQDLPV